MSEQQFLLYEQSQSLILTPCPLDPSIEFLSNCASQSLALDPVSFSLPQLPYMLLAVRASTGKSMVCADVLFPHNLIRHHGWISMVSNVVYHLPQHMYNIGLSSWPCPCTLRCARTGMASAACMQADGREDHTWDAKMPLHLIAEVDEAMVSFLAICLDRRVMSILHTNRTLLFGTISDAFFSSPISGRCSKSSKHAIPSLSADSAA